MALLQQGAVTEVSLGTVTGLVQSPNRAAWGQPCTAGMVAQ